MGSIISLVSSIINFVTKIKKEHDSDALEEKREQVDKLQHPIIPPFFYPNKKIRGENLKDNHPYSNDGITKALGNSVIPAGYSIEQLKNVGFTQEVKSYLLRRKNERDTLAKNLKDAVTKLKVMIITGFPDVD